MRIVVWNMAANTVSRAPSVHERAWRYLDALQPDLALIQEARVPGWARARPEWTIVQDPVQLWGSAIVVGPALELTAFDGPRTGSLEAGLLATAIATQPDGARLLVGSVHTPIGAASAAELGGLDPALARTPRYRIPCRRDVAYAIYRERVAGKRFIVGGDWNTSPLWDELHRGTSEVDYFDRAEQDGWVDCYRTLHPEGEGRTWFRGSDPPYQLDHVFCDRDTAASLVACDIDPCPADTMSLSDHAPLVLVLAA